MYNKGLFADWVPKPMMLLLILLFLFPILTVGGVYSNNLTDISGRMGTYSEYIQMANNAATIGMSMCIILVMRFKMRFRSKEIMVFCLTVIAAMVYICSFTDNYFVFILCNFVIGFLKMPAMMEIILPVMFIISPKGERTRFYSVFYPISIGSSTIVGYYLSANVFENGIENVYLMFVVLMIFLAIVALIFMHNKRFGFKLPLYQIDWISLGLLTSSFMCLNYTLVFMKQQNWFNSESIALSAIAFVVQFLLVILRQRGRKRKLIDFSLFVKYKNLSHSLVLLVFLGLYLSSASVFMQWTMAALGYNNMINAELNMWSIVGVVLAGVVALIGYNKKWNMKYFILLGFAGFFFNILLTYLIIQPNMSYEMLIFPTILKGFGMCSLFISIWYYATLGLPSLESLGVYGIIMPFRTFVVTAGASALFGFYSSQFQQQSMADMSNYWDANLLGPSAMMGYGTMQIASLLASGKTLLGWLLWSFVPLTIIILLNRYEKKNLRKKVLFNKLIKGNSVKGYNFSNRR